MKSKNEKWTTLGFVGVDSGTLIVGDFCYLIGWDDALYEKWIVKGFKGRSRRIEDRFSVAFTSGLGDGAYEVKALIKDYGATLGKRIKEVKIILIDDRRCKSKK
jgi:hypothetical protein